MQQTSAKRVLTRLSEVGDPLGIAQEMEIQSCKQVVYAQPRIYSGE